MNVGSITMNVVLNEYIKGEGSGYSYGGQNYSLGAFKDYVDRVTRRAGEMDLVVSAIILCQTNSIFKDPENKGGNYTMPNLTTAKAFNLYAAALEHMASTHCTQGNRISHWIMHNEVDFANEWTNMGDQPMLRYLDRYIKSMRICYNIARQYDQNASVLGSYTHCWTVADGNYAPKKMLEATVAYSEAEGDFRWGVAYHPYPQDLTKPSFWVNDTQATYSMTTRYITFKNLEVIDAWIKQKENLYKGTTKRVLFLSEQGTNSPSYSQTDLALQAAGGAWAWKKISKLDGIDAMQWHNWADNKAEGGLRIVFALSLKVVSQILPLSLSGTSGRPPARPKRIPSLISTRPPSASPTGIPSLRLSSRSPRPAPSVVVYRLQLFYLSQRLSVTKSICSRIASC